MADQHEGGMTAAIYGSLADAEGALNDLLAAGVPYEQTIMGAHTGADPLRGAVSAELPEQFWSIAVRDSDHDAHKVREGLGAHRPLSLGRLSGAPRERTDPERGAVAWGHFVFESSASTNQQTETAGTSGTTGVISSGAFADGARVQKEPGE